MKNKPLACSLLRYSMIEDGDYPSSGSKPLLTSRLSVFLQQTRDPPPPTTTFSKPATYSNCFTHSFTQGSSPNIRRTRNDDEYYGSSETSGRLPTTASSISSRSSSARRSGRAAQGGTGGHPSYQADTLTSIRRSKERSETHTDSPSRFVAKIIKNWFVLNHLSPGSDELPAVGAPAQCLRARWRRTTGTLRRAEPTRGRPGSGRTRG